MAAVPSIGRASLVEAPRRAPQAAATEGLYERHSAKILAYCRHQLGSREEAEDAVQTTFMNAFRALGRGVVPEAETAWLFKIAENVCLSRRRSSWRRGRIESPSDFEVIEEIVPGPSRQRDELIGIEDALASMPEQQRRAILLREWQGLSYREIAEELEVSQSAVETLIFRARRSLAQGLEQPDTLAKPKRKSFRRALHALDLGTVAAALKTLLAGSAAVKATAAAVAVTAAAGTVATVGPELESKRHPAQPAAPAPTLVASVPVEKPAAVAAEGTTFVSSLAPVGPTKVSAKRTTAAPAAKPAAVKQRPARSAAPAQAAASVPAPTPAQAEPVEPAAQPTSAPAAETPGHESKPEQPAQAAQPDRTDEGKIDEGRREEKAAPREQAAAPSDSRGEAKGKGNGKHEAPAVEPPAPSAVTATVVVAPQAEDSSGKGERGRGKEKAKESEPTPLVEAAPAPIQETSVQPVAGTSSQPAPTAVHSASSGHGGGNDKGEDNGGDKGKGKGKDK